MGVISLYLLAAVEVTSLSRRRLSPRAWRRTHFLSFPLFGLSTVHLLAAGTDATNPALFAAVAGVTAAVVVLTTIRVRDALEGQPGGAGVAAGR